QFATAATLDSGTALRISPAIAEPRVVVDFLKTGITQAELAANTLDRRSDVCPISVHSAAGDEADVVQAIVDAPIGHEPADIRRKMVDNGVFAAREVDVDSIPIGPTDIRLEDKPEADPDHLGQPIVLQSVVIDRAPQIVIDLVEDEAVVVGRGPAGQEYYRQVHALPAQLGQQADAGGENDDDVSIVVGGKRCKQRTAVGKALHSKPAS